MSFWRRMGRFLSARSGAVLIALLVIAAVLAVGAAKLDFATGQDSYLDKGTATAKANKAYQDLFGGETMLVLFTAQQGKTVADLFSAANQKQMTDVTAKLRAQAGNGVVFSVVDPVTLLTWSSDLVTKNVALQAQGRAAAKETDPAKVAVRKNDSQLTLARALAAGKQSIDNPKWVEFLLYDNDNWTLSGSTPTPPSADKLVIRRSLQAFIPDTHHAVLGVVLKGNATLDELAAGNKLVKDAMKGTSWESADAIVTGTPTFLTEINDYLQGGMLTLGLIAAGVMVLVLGLTFGVRWRFLPLAVVLVGVVWGFGAFGFTGTKLSLVTISGLPILIGLGMDFAIQIHNRAQEEVTVADASTSAFEETMVRLGPPLALATFVAVVCFLVMRISHVPMIQDFGVLLAIGIVALVVVGVTATVAVLARRERRSPTTTPLKHGWSEKLVVWLGALPRAMVVPLIVFSLVVPVLGLALEHNAKIESDPINWANQGSQTIKNARALERETGFATTLGVFVQTKDYPKDGIFTDELSAFVHDFELNAVHDEGKLLPAGSSLVSVVSYLIDIPGATAFPPSGVDLLQAYNVAPPDLQRVLVADNGNAMQVTFNVGPSSLETRASLVSRLEKAIADPPDGRAAMPSGTAATPAGLARVGVALLHNLTAGRSAFTYVTLLLVAAIFALRFRNLGLAALAMIPVLIAAGAASTLVALLNLTLSPLTTVGAPLVIALCAEFSILIVSRYVEERERGMSPRDAVDHASARTGRAFTASALATIGGFGVLVFSSLPLLRDFGTIVTLKVAVALLSALVVVPPVAVWADEHGLLGLGGDDGAGARSRRAPTTDRGAAEAGRSSVPALAVGVVLGVLGLVLAVREARSDTTTALVPRTVPAAAAPATIPPSTTTTPPTTAPPTTAPPPGATTTAPTTLPPGPAARPESGLVAGAIYDAFTTAGAEPGVARCTADALLAKTSEADLLAAGLATRPPAPAAAALVAAAADACGVSRAVQDAVVKASGG